MASVASDKFLAATAGAEVSSPWGEFEVQTNSAGSGLHTPERWQEITRGNTGKSPSLHWKVTVSPSVVPVVDTTLTLGDNNGWPQSRKFNYNHKTRSL